MRVWWQRIAGGGNKGVTFLRLACVGGSVLAWAGATFWALGSQAEAKPSAGWTTSDASTPKGASADLCGGRLARVEELFRQADGFPKTAGFLPTAPGFEPPDMNGGPWPEPPMTLIEWGPSGTTFDGRPLDIGESGPVAVAAAIVREVAAGQGRWRLAHPGETPRQTRVGLWLDRRARATDAWRIIERLRDRYDVHVLGVMRPRSRAMDLPEGAWRRVEAVQRASDAGTRSKLVSEALRDAFGTCAGRERYVPADPSLVDSIRLRAGILSALKGCACAGVDLQLIEGVALPEFDRPVVVLQRIRPRNRSRTIVEVSRTATVQEFVRRLPPTTEFGIKWTKR